MNKVEGYQKFKDCHRGATGIVIANGPGLKNVPIDFLKKYPTLGCNRITLMAPEFVPTYYSCLGRNQINTEEKRQTFYDMLGHPDCKAAFLNRMHAHSFPFDEVYSIMGGKSYGFAETRFFSLEPLDITGLGYTMVYVNLQIAYYMGFQTVLLVGLDHHYPDTDQKHFYKDGDVPDFEVAPGPLYQNNTNIWQQGADLVFNIASEVYKDAGKDIINLSEPSKCTIFRKEALSAWLGKG
jgi:hypothetical protein